MHTKYKVLILYFSLSLSTAFFYFETVHQYFFRFYPHSVNVNLVIGAQTTLSLYFLIYLFILSILFIYKTDLKITPKFRFIIYFLLPYLICIFVWILNSHNRNSEFLVSDWLINSYIIHFVFVITLLSYFVDYILRVLVFRSKDELMKIL